MSPKNYSKSSVRPSVAEPVRFPSILAFCEKLAFRIVLSNLYTPEVLVALFSFDLSNIELSYNYFLQIFLPFWVEPEP